MQKQTLCFFYKCLTKVKNLAKGHKASERHQQRAKQFESRFQMSTLPVECSVNSDV